MLPLKWALRWASGNLCFSIQQKWKRFLRKLPPCVSDNMKSLLLLLLLAAFGLAWSPYSSNPQPLRTSVVHLFEWRWVDVALECERYLAPNGFAGVQVSPPNENLVILNPWRPWWERYQPISYKLCSRSGSENEFRDMVTRCNNVRVHIYVDAVINHMCSSGAGSGSGGICGSFFNAGVRDFPAVPYSSFDFNDRICKTASGDIENYSDPIQVRNCRLSGLVDLAQGREDVRSKIAEYMNHLIDIGVAGFRIDAAKHIWPEDINVILSKVNNLNTRWFIKGSRPFIYQEVIDLGGEAVQSSEYFRNGRVTEFKYGIQLGTVLRKWNGAKMADLKYWTSGIIHPPRAHGQESRIQMSLGLHMEPTALGSPIPSMINGGLKVVVGVDIMLKRLCFLDHTQKRQLFFTRLLGSKNTSFIETV